MPSTAKIIIGGLLEAQQIMEHGKGPVHFLSGEGIGHLEHHRVNDGDGHRVNVLPGDPAILGVRPIFPISEIRPFIRSPQRKIRYWASAVSMSWPKARNRRTIQSTRSLCPCRTKAHLRPFVPDNPGQFFHAGHPVVGTVS